MSSSRGSWRSDLGELGGELALREGEGGNFLDVVVSCPASHEDALGALLERVRALSSRDELAQRGLDIGFRVEDVVSVDVTCPDSAEPELVRRWLARRLNQETPITVVRDGQVWTMSLTFARRGFLPGSQRARYSRSEGRVTLEAFELHPVEHCNLRCAHCCNMSPYVSDKTMTLAEIEELCGIVGRHVRADVFKVMGGEPLLHPQITDVVRIIRRSGVGRVVRLFTNGLLLHRMDDGFWRALDQLTISNYTSAPVKPATLALAAQKAREFDVVLNVKPVSAFSEVLSETRRDDGNAIQRTYDECWLRHRCIVVRKRRFYMCTRSAYASDFHSKILHGAHPEDDARALEDGVAIDREDFGDALLTYLNRGVPLASCRYCHGSSGPVGPHRQLTKLEVRRGQLHGERR